MNPGEYVNGGGMSLHAPSIIAMGKDAFIAFYVDRITFINDRLGRIKYLTGKYEDCVNLMNPPKYKAAECVAEEQECTSEPECECHDKPVKRTSKTRKSTEKKE